MNEMFLVSRHLKRDQNNPALRNLYTLNKYIHMYMYAHNLTLHHSGHALSQVKLSCLITTTLLSDFISERSYYMYHTLFALKLML